MRKFFFGLVLGVAFTAASSVYADDIVQNIVGKKIEGEFPVKIVGKSLNTKAAVVEGTSYVPVRAIGEALNMDVKFDATTGIELTRKGAAVVPNTFTPEDKEALRLRIENSNKILELEKQKKPLEEARDAAYRIVSEADMMQRQTPDYQYNEAYYTAKQAWETKKAELAEVDKQIADLYAEAQQ